VVLGQPVLDARGLMGQVVELMPYTSRVLLLTDTTHSIPVQVNRNGLRAIASGTGNPERLELRHVADTADIKEGDLLVSSGLGQRFPAGYPVATVKEVIHDSGQPFAIVRAVPTAALNRSRYLLLVFSDGRSPEQRATDAAQAQEAMDRQAADPAAAAAGNPAVAPATATIPAGAHVVPGSGTGHAPVVPGAHVPATPATPAAATHANPASAVPPAHGTANPASAATPAHATGAATHAPGAQTPATASPANPASPASPASAVPRPAKRTKPAATKPPVDAPAEPQQRED
jgi:rod shape-determining protein MreC